MRKVPYQADIAAALERAREEAYREGDFSRVEPSREAREMTEEEYVAWEPDTLLDSQPFSGTHSVIDMTGVSATPEGGRVAPLPAEDMATWFGTREPTAAAVEKALEEGLDAFERWHGAYVVAYAEGRPDSIYFFGWSGD